MIPIKTSKVSIIVTSYNQALFLEQAIDSLLSQTYENLEIIVVDDGSTEQNTIDLLRKISQLPRIRVIRQMNLGVASARNNGYLASTGEYVQFLDGDDFLCNEKIEKQVRQLEANSGFDVALSDYYLTDANKTRKWQDSTPKFSSFKLDMPDFLFKWDRGCLSIPIHCALFNRKIIPALPFVDGMFSHEDWIFWVSISANAPRFVILEEPLVYYRIHDKSSNVPTPRGLAWLRAICEIQKTVKGLPENFLEESLRHFCGNYLPRIIRCAGNVDDGNSFGCRKNAIVRNPLVSVIMPCYNSVRTPIKRKYIDMAIRSIIKQTYVNWELIAIDDGSKDDTLDYLLEWGKTDSRIKVLPLSENVGVAKALNAGAQRAEGKYLARMDDDDISFPRRLELQVELLEREPDIDLVGAATYVIDEDSKIDCILSRCETYESSLKLAVGGDSPFVHGSIVVRKTAFDNVGGYNPDDQYMWAEDYELWYRLLKNGRGCNISSPLYGYRDYATSVSKTKHDKQRESSARIQELFVNHFRQYSPLERQAVCALASYDTAIDQNDTKFLTLLKYQAFWSAPSAEMLENKSFRPASAIKVSILVPTYNQPELLLKNLNSIAIQDFDDYEVIICDDSPSDIVMQVVENHSLRPKINYYKNAETLGPAGNWNKCAEYAKGDLIKYLHHDDYFQEPSALRKFVKAMEDNPAAGFAFCASQHVNETGELLEVFTGTEERRKALAADYRVLLEGNSVGAPSVTIYRKALHKNFEQQLKWFIDIDFYMMLLQQNPQFVYLKDPLVAILTESRCRVTSASEGHLETEVKEAYFLWKKWHGCNFADIAKTNYFVGLVARCSQKQLTMDFSLLTSEEKEFYLYLLNREYLASIRPELVVTNVELVHSTTTILRALLNHSKVRSFLDHVLPKGSRRRKFAKKVKIRLKKTLLGNN